MDGPTASVRHEFNSELVNGGPPWLSTDQNSPKALAMMAANVQVKPELGQLPSLNKILHPMSYWFRFRKSPARFPATRAASCNC